jgi:hypothetical protein
MKTCVSVLLALTLLSVTNSLRAQGTAFTYQGQLQNDGSAANGFFDFRFTLYPNSTGTGTPVGSTITQKDIGVTNGLFNTSLGFGAVFTGNQVWLAIDVRSNGVGTYTALTPLQELTPAPYAVFANTASNLSGTVSTSQLADSSITVTAGTGLSGGGTVALGGSITLNATGSAGSGVVSVTGNSDITATTVSRAVTLGDTATSADTPNLIVKRDGTGSFSADNLTLGGALTLPATTVSPDIIYFGTQLLLYGDNYGNFFTGPNAGNATMAGSGGTNNTAIGFKALLDNTTGVANTAVGYKALSTNTTGSDNTANGAGTLYSNTTGYDNTANGSLALLFNTTGQMNTANGMGALYYNDSGSNNTASGFGALYYNTSGSENVANGFAALYQCTTGGNNIALGLFAGAGFTGNESTNIDIGNIGIAGDNGIIRIGADQTVCYIAGTVYAAGYDLYDEKMLRENFEPVDFQAVLAKVASLPVSHWNYKRDGKGVDHIGPMAQDFQAAFQLSKHISVMDEGGVALAAIKGLNQKVEERDQSLHQQLKERDAEIQNLKRQNDSLAERLNDLETTVKQLAAQK